jgi:GxxExxY protein
MAIAIRDAGLIVDEEKPLPVWFRGYQIVKFRADLVVASVVIVEVKARPELDPFHKSQVLHYLKETDLEVGLLLNVGRRPEFASCLRAGPEGAATTSGRGRRPRTCRRSAFQAVIGPLVLIVRARICESMIPIRFVSERSASSKVFREIRVPLVIRCDPRLLGS